MVTGAGALGRRPRARRPAPAAPGRRGTARCGCRRAPEVGEHAAELVDHLLRAAQEPVVDAVGRHQRLEDPAQPVGVEPPGQQLDVLGLAGEHVHDLEPVGEAVLEVVHLVEEHHRAAGPVGVDQGHERAGLALEDRRHDREHRRDARSRPRSRRSASRRVGSSSVVNRPAGVITSSSSPTRSASTTLSLNAPPGQPLDPDPQHAGGGRGADRVAAAYVVAAADVEVLAVREGVVVAQLVGHLEGDRDRVVGQLVDRRDPQRVEHRVLGHEVRAAFRGP